MDESFVYAPRVDELVGTHVARSEGRGSFWIQGWFEYTSTTMVDFEGQSLPLSADRCHGATVGTFVILFAVLPINGKEKGRGLGAALLKDALLRTVQAADIIGCRAVMVHAKGDDAKAFYQCFGFKPSPNDPIRLFLLMKYIKASMGVNAS